MSMSQSQFQPNHGELDEGSAPAHSKNSGNERTKAAIMSSVDQDIPVQSLRDLLATLKKPADNKYFRCLCDDGVFRILTWLPTPPAQPTGIAVYDTLPLSPFYIKAYLDRHEWSQKKEDTFRGVDGRRVPQEQWMNPPPGILPSLGSKNERDEYMKREKEERKQLEERIARGEIEEEVGPACGSVQSDHNLDPR